MPGFVLGAHMKIADPRIDPCLVPHRSEAIIYAKDQPEYQPLPAIRTPGGMVVSRWTLTDAERKRVAEGEDIFLCLYTFNQPLQPVRLSVGPEDWSGER